MKVSYRDIGPSLLLIVLTALAGCNSGGPAAKIKPTLQDSAETEGVLVGTVSQFASIVGGADQAVEGIGLVVGLGDRGSREVPKGVRKRLISELKQSGIQKILPNGKAVGPDTLIDEMDTAVVFVNAMIPAGAPEGTPIEVAVSALPQSQTLSLEGGLLLATPLRLFVSGAGGPKHSMPMAMAKGSVFVNPFIDLREEGAASRLREGRIIGGGITTVPRKLRLVLERPDYKMVDLIQRRINERFGFTPAVANARSPQYIEIRIPETYHKDYRRFLQLIAHLYVWQGATLEQGKARQLAKDILLPTARHEDISLVWEAMGAQVLPLFRHLYTSDNTAVAYYSARAGLRLDDSQAMEVIAQFAKTASPYRLEAIEELGRIADARALDTLWILLESDDSLVRVAAYEALGPGRLVRGVSRYDVGGQFQLEIVPTTGKFLVYATTTGQPKLVVFGLGLRLSKPIFYNGPDDTVTIHAGEDDECLGVYGRMGPKKILSKGMRIPFDVDSLVKVMGGLPKQAADGTFDALGLSYSQVVGVVQQLCENGSVKAIPAEFVLQRPDAISKIFAGQSPAGRPDSADSP
ncbi:MAG: flagellar basal body P-ring protein FlgI [Planctomycetes bacterium]|nr:flagellar basal body P-ring protein FlgI [Planctomycetota bacterium]